MGTELTATRYRSGYFILEHVQVGAVRFMGAKGLGEITPINIVFDGEKHVAEYDKPISIDRATMPGARPTILYFERNDVMVVSGRRLEMYSAEPLSYAVLAVRNMLRAGQIVEVHDIAEFEGIYAVAALIPTETNNDNYLVTVAQRGGYELHVISKRKWTIKVEMCTPKFSMDGVWVACTQRILADNDRYKPAGVPVMHVPSGQHTLITSDLIDTEAPELVEVRDVFLQPADASNTLVVISYRRPDYRSARPVDRHPLSDFDKIHFVVFRLEFGPSGIVVHVFHRHTTWYLTRDMNRRASAVGPHVVYGDSYCWGFFDFSKSHPRSFSREGNFRDASFSPGGQLFAVTMQDNVTVYNTHGYTALFTISMRVHEVDNMLHMPSTFFSNVKGRLALVCAGFPGRLTVASIPDLPCYLVRVLTHLARSGARKPSLFVVDTIVKLSFKFF
jgi:hypothetical protein